MPKSSKPRKKYQRPDWAAEAARQRGAPGHVGADELRGVFDRLKEPVDKPSEIPAAAHEVPTPPPAQARVARGRYVVPAAIGAGAIGGGAYLLHRRRRNAVSKTLINPLTGEAVVVEKCYPIEDEVDKRASVDAARAAGRRAKYGFQSGRAGGSHDELAGMFRSRAVRGGRRAGRASREVTSDRALFGAGGVAVGAALPRKKVEKADDSASVGRRVTAGLLPSYHGAVAGRKGKKLRATGNEYLGAAAGIGAGVLATRGRVAGAATRRAASEVAGAMEHGESPFRGAGRALRTKEYGRHAALTLGTAGVGAQFGVNRNQRKGYYKPQVSKASGGCFVPGGVITGVSTGTGSTWERGGTSHANKLTHKTHKPRQKPRGTLLQVKHGGRKVSGSTVGKMYSETGRGVGKRLVEVQ